MDAWTYGIYLLVFTFDISLVRCAHSFDIDVNTRRQIPYLRATMYYSLCIRSYCLSSELDIATALETQEQAKKILKTNCTHTFYPRWSVSHILRLRFWIVFVYIKRILLNRAFVISRFCSIHWIVILEGLKKIVSYIIYREVCYIEDG